MVFIKLFILLLIFLVCLYSGKIIAKKYSERVDELKDMKNGLNMFLTKIRFFPLIFKGNGVLLCFFTFCVF